MKKLNNFIAFGMLFNGVFIFSTRTDLIPDIIAGLCAGVGIGLTLLGIYSINHDISKLKDYKKRILGKFSR